MCTSLAANGIRLIPDYAGSTRRNSPLMFETRAHPRLRGEHIEGVVASFADSGSSPTTRGAHQVTQQDGVLQRLIPDYAGSTSSCGSMIFSYSAHPRLRGEHSTELWQQGNKRGSSPTTRGARRPPSNYQRASRLIPDYAGSTSFYPEIPLSIPAHPRLRGEHDPVPATEALDEGSSPTTRGAL